MTHTYALLEISAPAFNEITRKVAAAGHAQAFRGNDPPEIDMHGIGLTVDPAIKPGMTVIEMTTILSHRTKTGMVQLRVNDTTVQMTLDKAREVAGLLAMAIEAAVSDQLIFEFLTTKVGLDEARASRALLDFRELRQGSRSVVFPS